MDHGRTGPPGFAGPLITSSFVRAELAAAFAGRLGEASAPAARRAMASWWRSCQAALGPVSGPRNVLDRGAAPLVCLLGYRVSIPPAVLVPGVLVSGLDAGAGATVGLLVGGWAASLDRLWRAAARVGIGLDAHWCLCFNGSGLRLVDTRRAYARRFIEFDVVRTLGDTATFELFWGLLRAGAVAEPRGHPGQPARALVDEIIGAAERHRAGVNRSLQQGVQVALVRLLEGLEAGRRTGRGRAALAGRFEQCLTIVYRLLFLLFAEARGLVPAWHPLYRTAYTLDALYAQIAWDASGRGVWETLQAIFRLARAGCHADDLRVTAFNGRLFDALHTPLAERRARPGPVRDALMSLMVRRRADGRGVERIAYGELGVEQLGSIYEEVLERAPELVDDGVPGHDRAERSARGNNSRGHAHGAGPDPGRGSARLRPAWARADRKSTGTFYTPRSITDYLVRRTLHPLVDGLGSDDILRLRIVDPAMGSGAFLVAACRYLAAAYEAALVREQSGPDDIEAGERVEFHRLIARYCLYGVDINPMAVQLARLSLWLVTLAGDRPLSFLDHHLRVGNSLAGATPDDLARQWPAPLLHRRRSRSISLPLLDLDSLADGLSEAVPLWTQLAADADDSAAAVAGKERLFARLTGPDAPLARWKAAADLWCACWFWDGELPFTRAGFSALTDLLVHGRAGVPPRDAAAWRAQADAVARRERFFHWPLAFPEVFFDASGRPLGRSGFDAVLGNPPWDMIRADSGDAPHRAAARTEAARWIRFVRESGLYGAAPPGHLNRYQLFIERAVSLVRPGGRVGLVAPFGLATDEGSAALRRLLFERCDTDTLVSFENRAGVFPVHRSVKFILLTSTRGRPTRVTRCRFGVRDPRRLDAIPDQDAEPGASPVIEITPAFLDRISGPSLVVPELEGTEDVEILDRLHSRWRPLGDSAGWGARFGRELNATDDRPLFRPAGEGLPVIEGKQIAPFVVDVAASRYAVPAEAARDRLEPGRTFARARLAYRDVAAATNRVTLIAAVLPAATVSTHTVFCLREPRDDETQHFLCGVLNSFVANYLVRQRVTTHVTVACVARLPVPPPRGQGWLTGEIAAIARRLAGRPADAPSLEARLQALVAHLYGLDARELGRVLRTFPLVPARAREAALAELVALDTSRR